MDEHYFPYNNDNTISVAGDLNIAIHEDPNSKYGADTFDFMNPGSAGGYPGLLSNYHLAKEFPGWMLPMAQFNCSGSDFTTSPASTANHGIFPSLDGHNPFDASFGGAACSDSQQQLPYDIPSSQNPVHSSCMAWTPPIMAYAAPINLESTEFHAPQPKRGNAEVGNGDSFHGGPVELLENCAISLARPPKRRRTLERTNKPLNLGSSGHDLPLRHSTLQTTATAEVEGRIHQKLSRNTASTARKERKDKSKDLETESKDKNNSEVPDKEKERHKHVEMKYRKQMKDRFEDLLLALPLQAVSIDTDGRSGVVFQKKIRRGKVLDLAKEHIDLLQRQEDHLLREQQLLQGEVKVYEDAWFGSMGVPGPNELKLL
jgi:hypothetical protein